MRARQRQGCLVTAHQTFFVACDNCDTRDYDISRNGWMYRVLSAELKARLISEGWELGHREDGSRFDLCPRCRKSTMADTQPMRLPAALPSEKLKK